MNKELFSGILCCTLCTSALLAQQNHSPYYPPHMSYSWGGQSNESQQQQPQQSQPYSPYQQQRSDNNGQPPPPQQQPAPPRQAAGHCPACGSGSTSSAGPNAQPEGKEINPMAGPRTCSGTGAFITGSFIYWTARVNGLSYATSGARNGSDPDSPSRGNFKYPDWEFDPGFKVGLGFSLDHDGWDSLVQYTWLYTGTQKDRTRQSDINTTTLIPTWNIAFAFPDDNLLPQRITFGESKWELKFNAIDWEVGRNFYVSPRLKLRPSVGLKGTWHKQEYDVTVVESSASTATEFVMKQDHDFWGIGPRGGINTAWQFNPFFSLIGDLFLSGLWSNFDVERKDTERQTISGGVPVDEPSTTNYFSKSDFYTLTPVLEIMIGLRAETWFSNDDFHVSLDAGWEGQVWWSQNQYIQLRSEANHEGNMVLQGLTIKLRLDF